MEENKKRKVYAFFKTKYMYPYSCLCNRKILIKINASTFICIIKTLLKTYSYGGGEKNENQSSKGKLFLHPSARFQDFITYVEDNFTWANVKASCLISFPSFLSKISHHHHLAASECMMAAMTRSITSKHHSETFTTGLLHTFIPLHVVIFPQIGMMILSPFPFCQARSCLCLCYHCCLCL